MAEALADNHPDGIGGEHHGTVLAPGLKEHLEEDVLSDVVKALLCKTAGEDGWGCVRKTVLGIAQRPGKVFPGNREAYATGNRRHLVQGKGDKTVPPGYFSFLGAGTGHQAEYSDDGN